MRTFHVSTLLVFVCSILCVRADEPLSPPKRYEVNSASKKFVATVDPKRGVVVRAAGSRKVLWKLPGAWSRRTFLADDGEHFVTSYDGLNLIPLDYSTNLVLITFWHKSEKIGDVTVGALFPNPKVLERTVSHYHWGGVDALTNSTLTVHRCDDREVKFDITTGKVIK